MATEFADYATNVVITSSPGRYEQLLPHLGLRARHPLLRAGQDQRGRHRLGHASPRRLSPPMCSPPGASPCRRPATSSVSAKGWCWLPMSRRSSSPASPSAPTACSCSGLAPADAQFQVQWTPSLAPPAWTSFTNILTSTNGVFLFLDDGSQSVALTAPRYYRLQQLR